MSKTLRIFRGMATDINADETTGRVTTKLVAEIPEINISLQANVDHFFNPNNNEGIWYDVLKEFPELPENCLITFHDEQGTSLLFWYRGMLVGSKGMNELETEIIGPEAPRINHIRLDSWVFRVVHWNQLEERYKEVVLEN